MTDIRIRLDRNGAGSFSGSGGLALHNDDYLFVQKLLAGGSADWGHFVDRYQRVVLARLRSKSQECRRHLRGADIEDLCADVFKSLIENNYSSLRRFRGDSSLATWLTVVAANQCLKYLDRKSNRLLPSLDEQRDIESLRIDSADNCDEILMRQEHWEHLMVALDELNRSDQRAITMFYIQEMSYRDISDKLGISINSVGPKLSLAIKKLRNLCKRDTESSWDLESPSSTGTNSASNSH